MTVVLVLLLLSAGGLPHLARGGGRVLRLLGAETGRLLGDTGDDTTTPESLNLSAFVVGRSGDAGKQPSESR